MTRHVTRRAFVVCAASVAGCSGLGGEAETTTAGSDNPAFGNAAQMGDLELASPAFDDGGPIPEKYGREAQDVNPPLEIGGVPDGVKSLALVVDDPDAVEPAGKVWAHWLVWNVDPGRATIPEGWTPSGAVEGTNDYGEIGYGGPNPPDGTHSYRFKLYALEGALDLSAGAERRALGAAMEGAVRARTQLEGTYPP